MKQNIIDKKEGNDEATIEAVPEEDIEWKSSIYK